MNGLGSIDLGMDYGEMDVDAVGTVNYNQETDEKKKMFFNLDCRIARDNQEMEEKVEFGGLKNIQK